MRDDKNGRVNKQNGRARTRGHRAAINPGRARSGAAKAAWLAAVPFRATWRRPYAAQALPLQLVVPNGTTSSRCRDRARVMAAPSCPERDIVITATTTMTQYVWATRPSRRGQSPPPAAGQSPRVSCVRHLALNEKTSTPPPHPVRGPCARRPQFLAPRGTTFFARSARWRLVLRRALQHVAPKRKTSAPSRG